MLIITQGNATLVDEPVDTPVKAQRGRERERWGQREREKERTRVRERRYDWRFDGQLSYFWPCALFQRVAEMKKKFEDDRQREVSLVVRDS